MSMPTDADGEELDPRDFLRDVPHASPEDAEKVREQTPGTRRHRLDEYEIPAERAEDREQ
jgi:hypothetical protein